jgi:predicted MFS family arabinose efflux permease
LNGTRICRSADDWKDAGVTDTQQPRPASGDAPSEASGSQRPANALTVPAFRLLWANNIFYFLVMNAQRFVIGWFVLDGLDGNEQDQALAVFAFGIPSIFIVLHAGVWADRHDRRRLLMGSQVASLIAMAAFAALLELDQLSFNWVLLLAVFAGVAAAVGQPVRSALVPALVQREQLFSAIAITALAMTMSMILGPVVSEAVGDAFGFAAAFWFLAGLLAVGVVFLIPLRVPGHEAEGPDDPSSTISSSRDSVGRQTAEAFRHVLADPSLKKLFLLLTVAGLTVNPAVMVTLQAFVKEDLGKEAGDAAPLLALMGVGIAISSVVVMRKGDMANKGAAFQRALMTGSTMTILMGRVTDYWMLLPLVTIMGLAGGFYINMNQGLIQANTPQRLMGRVMALYTLIQVGLLPIGSLMIGVISSFIGIGNTISIVAATCLATGIIVYVSDAEFRELS